MEVTPQTTSSASIDNEINPLGLGKLSHIDISGSNVSYVPLPATSQSDSIINYRVNAPSMETYVSRCIPERIDLHIHAIGTTSTVASPPLLLGPDIAGSYGIRQYADMRIKQAMNIQLNGFSLPVSQYSVLYPDIINKYNKYFRQNHPLSYPDVSQNYSDLLGANSNPLGSYANSLPLSSDEDIPRGAYPLRNVVRTSTTFDADVSLWGYLYYPGLLGVDQRNEQGLIRIRDIVVNETINLDPKYWWSMATGTTSTITSIVAHVVNQPTLYFKFISPPRELIPKGKLFYRHTRFDSFPTQSNSVNIAPNNVARIIGGNIQLTQVPSFVFSWAHEADENKTMNSTDTYMGLISLAFNFNNQRDLNASATAYDYWLISKQNGFMGGLNDFLGYVTSTAGATIGSSGSLVCSKMGTNVSLGSNRISLNESGAYNFSTNAVFINTNQRNNIILPVMETICAYVQDFVISEGGVITIENPNIPIENLAYGLGGSEGGEMFKGLEVVPSFEEGYAGGSFSSFWKHAKNILSQALPYLAPLSSLIGIPPQATSILTNLLNKPAGTGEGGASMAKKQLKEALKAL